MRWSPGTNIMLVEAYNPNYLDKEAPWAASQPGVSVVSMSWGANYPGESGDDSYFATPQGHAGVTFVASSGDGGFFAYPASSPNVLAVGGTTFSVDSSGDYLGETVWNDAGGGVDQNYPNKQGPDVAYNAGAGVQVCDTFDFPSGWGGMIGTSAAAPQWAGLIAIADQARALQGMSTLNGAQTLSSIHNLPSSDFDTDIPGSNSIGASGLGAIGKGSPIVVDVVARLSGMTIGDPPSNPQPPFTPPPSNPLPPFTPPPSNPLPPFTPPSNPQPPTYNPPDYPPNYNPPNNDSPPSPPPMLPPPPPSAVQLFLDGYTLAMDLSRPCGISAALADSALMHDIDAGGGFFNPYLDTGFSAALSARR